MADAPHFDYPFRFVGGHAKCVEQDSPEDVTNCVIAVLQTPPGFRTELPDFGCPDQAFREGGVDLQAVQGALSTWEPRAGYTLDATQLDAVTQRVQISIRSIPNAQ